MKKDPSIERFKRYMGWLVKNHDPSRTHYIYSLMDPRTKEVRYVGQTDDPKLRLIAHKSKGRQVHRGKIECSGVNAWLGELASAGLTPRMDIFKQITCKDGASCSPSCLKADRLEREVMRYFRDKLHAPLLNQK